MLGTDPVYSCCPGLIINTASFFHPQRCIGLDKLPFHPNYAPFHALEESHFLYCKNGVGCKALISLWPQNMNSVLSQARKNSDQLPFQKCQIAQVTSAPPNTKNPCHFGLHAQKHVVMSAESNLRLERKKLYFFSPLLLGGCVKKKNPARCPGERFGF